MYLILQHLYNCGSKHSKNRIKLISKYLSLNFFFLLAALKCL